MVVPQCALCPTGSALRPLSLSSQPVMWPGHAPYLLGPRPPRPKNQHSPQSGPTQPGLGGPLPEVTFLPLLPLLQWQGFWFCFEFPRHFSVPLMLFFKGSSFLKDLLHQALAIYLVFLGLFLLIGRKLMNYMYHLSFLTKLTAFILTINWIPD